MTTHQVSITLARIIRRVCIVLSALYLLAAVVLSLQYQWVLTYPIFFSGFVLTVCLSREAALRGAGGGPA